MKSAFLIAVITAVSGMARAADTIRDEASVPPYVLPSLPATPDEWKSAGGALLKTFGEQMYGITPLGRPDNLKFVVRGEKKDARGGRATRLRVGVLFEGSETGRQMELLVYLPNDVSGPVPVFLGLNFDGNYTCVTDPELPVPQHWAMGLFDNKLTGHQPVAASRGMFAHMWSVDWLIENGFGLATAAYGEIEPDENGRWRDGVRGLAKEPGPGDWGAVGAWAWGLSRAMDYLVSNDRIDAQRVIVCGFSRLGKAALWAGVQDERFAAVVSNGSGAGGIALTKRIFGERTGNLVKNFPHWFCGNFATYADREGEQPFDQHQLAALVAPRPLMATSGTDDLWADPRGEFLTLAAAAPVWEMSGIRKPLDAKEWPKAGKLVGSRIGYYLRKGGHDVTLEDWKEGMIPWAKKQLKYGGLPKPAAERYTRRLAAMPAAARTAWEEYFRKSDARRREYSEFLAAEVKAGGLTEPVPAPSGGGGFEFDSKEFEPLLTGPEGAALAASLISFQVPAGGWSKAVNCKVPRRKGMAFTSGDPDHYAGTFDNRSTTDQLKFLALRQSASPDDAVRTSVEKGIDYLLEAQYPNGGWPQNYPLEGGYHDSITLNDGAMLHVLEVLQSASRGEKGWEWLDSGRRERAGAALDRGVKALLELQVRIDGKPTVWAAQYDLLSMQPVSARAYELAGLSGGEGCEVIRFLFSVRPVTAEIRSAIETGMAWFAAHVIPGNQAGWARFYDLHTQQPFFPGKLDGRAWASEDAMRKVNPGGYDFSVRKPGDLPKWHEKWEKALSKELKGK